MFIVHRLQKMQQHFNHQFVLFVSFYRPSMSRGAGLGLERHHERDFVLSSIEEFVRRFDGKRPINKVNFKFLNNVKQFALI